MRHFLVEAGRGECATLALAAKMSHHVNHLNCLGSWLCFFLQVIGSHYKIDFKIVVCS
jgi:hypothetical protein